MLYTPCLAKSSRESCSLPPWYIHARYSGIPGPKGTVANMLNAESVPAKNPALDQAASTDPWPVAWIACSAGTSARAR